MTPGDKRKLDGPAVSAVLRKVRREAAGTIEEYVRTARLIRQNSTDAFGALTILEGPTYELFEKPVGGKADSRGCKSARVVLGPLVGLEQLHGTDAVSTYPSAITDVRKQIDNATYQWKSGHVINADFGGYGGSNENMTCLTSSANTSQTAFDNNIKNARSSLHKVYSALRKAGRRNDFFASLRYGIEINIKMSNDTWGDTYPYNCVSNSMSLCAAIRNEPAEKDIKDAPGGATKMDIQQFLRHIGEVQEFVDKANERHTVTNVQLDSVGDLGSRRGT